MQAPLNGGRTSSPVLGKGSPARYCEPPGTATVVSCPPGRTAGSLPAGNSAQQRPQGRLEPAALLRACGAPGYGPAASSAASLRQPPPPPLLSARPSGAACSLPNAESGEGSGRTGKEGGCEDEGKERNLLLAAPDSPQPPLRLGLAAAIFPPSPPLKMPGRNARREL